MGLVAAELMACAGAPEDEGLRCLVDLDAPCNLMCLRCPRKSRGEHPERRPGTSVAQRVIEQVAASGVERVGVAFYGGEPLLVLDRLLEHSAAVLEHCADEGVAYDAGVVTNGTLLDGHTARLLRAVGITRALVTLDGPRPQHDARRQLAEGGPTFDRIVGNLSVARHWLQVTIRFDASDPGRLGPLAPLLRLLDRERLLDGPHALELLVHRGTGYAAQARLLLDAVARKTPVAPDGGSAA
jgi:sulfatase maturation enzyme AslB (radical SAM superfamily)